ncbi:MAG: hypothetical protein P4M14_02925 [Gammaproteobacteria bacterium]|nr:hypothetical protein [Gammaproteobacteria bacterium]
MVKSRDTLTEAEAPPRVDRVVSPEDIAIEIDEAPAAAPPSRARSQSRAQSYGLGSISSLVKPNQAVVAETFIKSTPSPDIEVNRTRRPEIPPELIDQRIINDDHARHFIQHGAESRNPYEKIVAPVDALAIICISALGSKTDAFGKAINYDNKDFSPLMKSGAITQDNKTVYASLPFEFVAAAAIIAAKLGGPNSMLTSRVTLWSQDSIPSAPKPPSTKLKTGKGGISGGVIPVDIDTTTNEGPGGQLIALKQNGDHRPGADEKDITTVQWAKPLEQIITGLDKNPPEFTMLSSPEDIKKNGFMEFKVNCAEGGIDQAVYRVDLKQSNDSTVKPINIKETEAKAPKWWDENLFGNFSQKAREGFHVDYKKTPEAEFKPYEVYARLGKDGSKLPLSGDQDIFFIPRSEKYDLGALATEVVDTYDEVETHGIDGVENLIDKMKQVHLAVLEQDCEAGEISKEDMQKSINNFMVFLDSSHSYVHALGTITPYEAYFTIQLNNQIAKVKEQFKDDPEGLSNLVKNINVDLSIGLKNIKTVDIDLNTAWYKKNPAENSLRVNDNLEKGFHVAPVILELHVKHLANEPTSSIKSFDALKESINGLATEHEKDWKVYAKIGTDVAPPTLPGDKPPDPPYYKWVEVNQKNPIEPDKIVELMINANTENKQDPSHDASNKNAKGGEKCIIKFSEEGAVSNLGHEKANVLVDKIADKMHAYQPESPSKI